VNGGGVVGIMRANMLIGVIVFVSVDVAVVVTGIVVITIVIIVFIIAIIIIIIIITIIIIIIIIIIITHPPLSQLQPHTHAYYMRNKLLRHNTTHLNRTGRRHRQLISIPLLQPYT
jgi:hypothetical protein